ncbi:MAG: hypothetical protein WCK35_21500 [Chloroflexota bacterium]
MLARDFFKIPGPVRSDHEHLSAIMRWLCYAQDVTRSGGVSIGWSIKNNWQLPYPETSGYLIPTFLKYASFLGDSSYFDRAVKMGEWELGLQFANGAFPSSPGTGSIPLVFDTGQVIQGLNALFISTNDEKWLDAAIRAARWIVSCQNDNGSWIKGSHKNIVHTYYTRVAWPIFELSRLAGEPELGKGAESFLRWVFSMSHPDGWIDAMGFSMDLDPLTHTVAYTYEGLIECMEFVDSCLRDDILLLVERAMGEVVNYQQRENPTGSTRHAMPAYIGQDWHFHGNFSCLVGNAQLALLLLRLYEATGKLEYCQTGVAILEQVKSAQILESHDPNLNGALGASWPIWGGYGSLSFINWAGKFYADALLLNISIKKNQSEV